MPVGVDNHAQQLRKGNNCIRYVFHCLGRITVPVFEEGKQTCAAAEEGKQLHQVCISLAWKDYCPSFGGRETTMSGVSFIAFEGLLSLTFKYM